MNELGSHPVDQPTSDRRSFLSTASSVAMAGGLVAGYGSLAFLAAQFVYPSQASNLDWFFVADVNHLAGKDAIRYETPVGQRVTITRRGPGNSPTDFLALSTTCPHLGCQVHWEAQNNRFFCPCHNGAFDPSGKAIAGPPADAGQSLPTFPIEINNGLLFVQLPAGKLA